MWISTVIIPVLQSPLLRLGNLPRIEEDPVLVELGLHQGLLPITDTGI